MVANKEISDNPSPNSVTAPASHADKQADIDRKLRLYGVIQAFREGRYPSNAQIDATLDYTLANSPIETAKLSPDGKNLIADFQNIIKTAKKIVQVKNADELAQNFLFHSRHIDTGKVNPNNVKLPVGKDELNSDADQAVEHLRTLGKLIFTNSEARKLLKDIGLLGRDIAADAAVKAADVARPPEHELNKIDQPAPSNQWVGPNGEIRDHSDPAPDTGLAAKREQAKNAAQQARDGALQAKDEAQNSANKVAGAADNADPGQHVADEDRAAAAADQGGQQAAAEGQKLFDKLKSKIPEEHKDKAKEMHGRAKDYAKDKFPQERRDRFIYRLKKVVVENQRHRDYQEAIEFFLDRAETYHAHGKDVSKQGGSEALNVRHDTAYQKAEFELRTLLERFANDQSSQPIFDAVNQLYTDARNDQDLRAWFQQLDAYVRRVLQEPGYIMKDSSDQEGRRLLDLGKAFWDPQNGRYAGHKDALFDTLGNFFQSYADDPLNVQLGEDVKKFTKDLLYNSEGNLTYKSHLWNDVREVILPALAAHVGYVPIPRIEYTDDQIDLVIENLTLESQNLLPNVLEFEARNYFKVSPYDAIKDQSKHSFWVSFSQIQADIKAVNFYLKKKSGFPKLTDSGVADVFIGGKGISGKIHVESTGRKHHAFKVIDVKVKIDKLKFAVRDSKFSFLITTFKPLLTGLVKKAVAKGIEEGIRGGLVQLDAQLSDISERVESAKDSDDPVGTVDALKSAYADKKSEAKSAKEAATPPGKFQITAQRQSRLVEWEGPNSMIAKQGEMKDLASKTSGSHEWHSPAFDIVGGSPTSVPSKSSITPVPHTSGSPNPNSQSSPRTGYAQDSSVYGNTSSGLAGAQGLAGHESSSHAHAGNGSTLASNAPGTGLGGFQSGIPSTHNGTLATEATGYNVGSAAVQQGSAAGGPPSTARAY